MSPQMIVGLVLAGLLVLLIVWIAIVEALD